MSACVAAAWLPFANQVDSTERLAGMAALLTPPVAARCQVDQAWPWSGHGLDDELVPTASTSTTTQARAQASLHPPSDIAPRRKMRLHQRPDSGHNIAVPESAAVVPDASTRAKQKKRGRKPNKCSPEATVTQPHKVPLQIPQDFEDDYTEDDDDDYDSEELPRDPRRRRTLERNRIAARKCRVRKRDEASALASREQLVEDQNRFLLSSYNSLSNEVYVLKTELLRHTHCNCTLIQEYIANEARRSVDKLNKSPRTTHSYARTTPTSLDDQTRRSSYFGTDPDDSNHYVCAEGPGAEAYMDGQIKSPPVNDGNVATPMGAYGHDYRRFHASFDGQICNDTQQHSYDVYEGDVNNFFTQSNAPTFGQVLDSQVPVGKAAPMPPSWTEHHVFST